MTPTRFEFTSYVDRDGYKIVPAKRPPHQPGQTQADRILNSSRASWAEERIVGLGGDKRKLPLGQYPTAYSEFANVRTREELLSFITKYGSLTKKDEIPQLLHTAKEMKECLRSKKLPLRSIADLKASASIDKAKGGITIKVRPTRLLDALWLQLGGELSGGAEFRQCKHCGNWFPVGGKSGRRLVARFCSDKHRIEFNSLERTRKKRSR
jgi:hypothetical protein